MVYISIVFTVTLHCCEVLYLPWGNNINCKCLGMKP